MRAIKGEEVLLVTGGAGFMGASFIQYKLRDPAFKGRLVVLDLMVHTLCSLRVKLFAEDARVSVYKGDIADRQLVSTLYDKYRFDGVVHFAAETHVDKSIHDPSIFALTNIDKTVALLNVVKTWKGCHFHHISTDEVFGSIKEGQFYETDPYRPNSPYAASKAGSDHMVRAFGKTYSVPYTISHASNNFGPFQYPEKLLPLMMLRLIREEPLPIYGRGEQRREWLYVDDHSSAVDTILFQSEPGSCYNVGSGMEMSNLALVKKLASIFEQLGYVKPGAFDRQVTFVEDRPGHDFRYRLNCDRLKALGWKPQVDLDVGLKQMAEHFIKDRQLRMDGDSQYQAWVERQYGELLS